MTAYHATHVAYQVGSQIFGYERTFTGRRADVEAILEAARPPECASRLAGLFTSADVAHAQRFLMAERQSHGCQIRLFKVEIDDCRPHPLVLVDRISQLLNDVRVQSIVAEYWNPRREWEFVEFVVPTMHIIEEVGPSSSVALAMASLTHEGDRSRAHAEWPLDEA